MFFVLEMNFVFYFFVDQNFSSFLFLVIEGLEKVTKVFAVSV